MDLSRLRSEYYLREWDKTFAVGHRQSLTYALPNAHTFYQARINPSGAEPSQYLDFAKLDLQSGDARGAINALGNMKRSIHQTISAFLQLLCLDRAYSRVNFPEKLKLLADLDAFPTRLLDGLNRKRNLVEHEYAFANADEIRDLVEAGELFVLLAYAFLRKTVTGAYVGRVNDPQCYDWQLDYASSSVSISEVDAPHFVEASFGRVHFNMDERSPRLNTRCIEITRLNSSEWLPLLDLFMYCTKQTALELPRADETGMVRSKHSMIFADPPEFAK